MRRSFTLAAAFAVLTAGWLVAQQPSPSPSSPSPKSPTPVKPAPPTPPSAAMPLELTGSLADSAKADAAPPSRVITNAKDWAGLQLAWDIKDPPKVDFAKELLVVATSRSGQVTIETDLGPDGDLRIRALDNNDVRGGFRYRIKAVDRAGVKTVNGLPLPRD